MRIVLDDVSLSIKGRYNLDRTLFGMNYGLGKIHEGVKVSFSLKVPRRTSADTQSGPKDSGNRVDPY